MQDGSIAEVTTYPSGKETITKIQMGDSPAQQAFSVEQAKEKAKTIQKYRENTQFNASISSKLDQLEDVIKDNNFENAVGPLDAPLALKTGLGSPDVKYLSSSIEEITGDIQKEMAKSFGGRTTNFMIRFVKDIKPSTEDPGAVFIGKYDAMRASQRFDKEFNRRVVDLMDNKGYSQEDAMEIAEKSLNFKDFKSNMLKFKEDARKATTFSNSHKNIPIKKGKDGSFFAVFPDENGIAQTIPIDQYDAYMKEMRK